MVADGIVGGMDAKGAGVIGHKEQQVERPRKHVSQKATSVAKADALLLNLLQSEGFFL